MVWYLGRVSGALFFFCVGYLARDRRLLKILSVAPQREQAGGRVRVGHAVKNVESLCEVGALFSALVPRHRHLSF
jgi:hypothetical protein